MLPAIGPPFWQRPSNHQDRVFDIYGELDQWMHAPGIFDHIDISRGYLPEDITVTTGHESAGRQSYLEA